MILVVLSSPLHAQEESSALAAAEAEYYQIAPLPMPEGVVLEVGGLATLPDGTIAASTRRGEVYLIENAGMRNGQPPYFRKFATGLHEILGLAWHDGTLYCAQRGELTRLHDHDGDGRADQYETVTQWPLSGHYHEYSFGPKVAPDGSMYVTTNIGFGEEDWWRGKSLAPWRGWTLKIDPTTGEYEPYATGMRSPCGIGLINGEFFYADNQGDWMGSGGLVHVEKGDFTGHPAGLRWTSEENSPVSLQTNDIYYRVNPQFARKGQPKSQPQNIEDEIPFSLYELAEELPGVKLPAVWLPHSILGLSTSEIIIDETDGAFGPFAGQILIGDQGQSKIMRVNLEEVDGVYQGCAFNFISGFKSGVLRMSWGEDGSLFVGQTNRGWGSTGPEPYALERVSWTGQTPFDMHSVTAEADGFTIHFTQPIDKTDAELGKMYEVTSFNYKYHPAYGSPIVDLKKHPVRGAIVADDGLSVRIAVDSLVQYHIHEIKPTGIRSYQGDKPLLHEAGYYTLNRIPAGDSTGLPQVEIIEEEPMAHNHHDHSEMDMAQTTDDGSTDNPSPTRKPEPKAETTASTANVDAPRAAAPSRARRGSTRGSLKRQTRPPSDWSGEAEANIVLSTLPGMRYDRTQLTVKAGQRVKLTFYNNDDMPHNLVLVKPGKMPEIGQAAAAMGLDGPAKMYVPSSSSVLNHTGLLGPGSNESIYFIAPETPGDYNYVCTFPGHWRTMNGVLRVTP
ncbi:MAG: plastocyanin/azurin family copper-binding protein [Bacteroidota bacterium]